MINMCSWLNNKVIISKWASKPCHKLGYCPYGTLVEEFPLHEKAIKFAAKHNKFIIFIKGKGWISCDKKAKGSFPDLNWAVGKVKEPYSCHIFGHDCPVFYHAERMRE